MTRISVVVLFILTLCFARSASAQSALGDKDSLVATLKTLPQDTNRVNSLLRLGKIASQAGVYDTAIIYAQQALDLATKLQFNRAIGTANIDMGASYWYVGNYTQALNVNYAALDVFQKINDQKGISQAYNNMGIVYASQQNFTKALECYLTTLGIKRALGDNKAISSTLINIGATYDQLKEYDKAFMYYREALILKRSTNDKRGEGICLLNIGQVHNRMKNSDSALYYFNASLDLRRSINDRRGIVSSLASLGQLKINLGEFKEAERDLLEADTISRALGTLDLTRTIWDQLTSLYDTTSRYKDALDAFRFFSELSDSINMEEANRNADKLEMNYKFEKEKIELAKEQEKKDAINDEADKRRVVWIIGVSALLVVVTIFSLFLFTRLRIIRKQKTIIERQKVLVEEKSKEVFDSINYAKRIQYTLLAQENFLIAHLKDHFVLFQPKDIVSGDFYWASAQGDKFFVAICDCTGHGVPGAFMSLLNISFLNEAIAERKMTDPAAILDFVRDKLIANISQDGGQDGMDAVLLSIDIKNRTVQYAGANNSPVVIGKVGVADCEGDKMPVGIGERMQPFSNHLLQLTEGDVLYVFTDGFADQFGGEKGKKYRRAKLLEKLSAISSQPMDAQKNHLQNEFTLWRGNLEQVDDVLVVGIRF